MTLIPFPNADGGFVFNCKDCGCSVLTLIHDGVPLCALCRWLDDRPQIPKEIRERLRAQQRSVMRDSSGENGCGNG